MFLGPSLCNDVHTCAVGKGGFAKCYKLVDQDTNEEWACKVVQKSSLTKQRHKAKVHAQADAPSSARIILCHLC